MSRCTLSAYSSYFELKLSDVIFDFVDFFAYENQSISRTGRFHLRILARNCINGSRYKGILLWHVFSANAYIMNVVSEVLRSPISSSFGLFSDEAVAFSFT